MLLQMVKCNNHRIRNSWIS